MRLKLNTKFFNDYIRFAFRGGQAVFNSIGEVGVRDVKQNFRTSGRNSGEQWDALEESTIRQRRKRSKKPLVDSRELMLSTSKLVKFDRVFITTNRTDKKRRENIAALHNFGNPSRRIPQREFMRFSQNAIDEMLELMKNKIVK
jgi:phage gpG-like protein